MADIKIYSAVVCPYAHRTRLVLQEKGIDFDLIVRQIRGLSPTELADIIRLLQSYITRPENTVRWRWKVGDVAFWDNRATQHYAVADYGDQPRRVQRVTIAGDIPLGIDGKYSQAIKGDSAAYIPNLVAA